jgi:hypothetical protein
MEFLVRLEINGGARHHHAGDESNRKRLQGRLAGSYAQGVKQQVPGGVTTLAFVMPSSPAASSTLLLAWRTGGEPLKFQRSTKRDAWANRPVSGSGASTSNFDFRSSFPANKKPRHRCRGFALLDIA